MTLKHAITALMKAGFKVTPKNAAAYHDLKKAYESRVKTGTLPPGSVKG